MMYQHSKVFSGAQENWGARGYRRKDTESPVALTVLRVPIDFFNDFNSIIYKFNSVQNGISLVSIKMQVTKDLGKQLDIRCFFIWYLSKNLFEMFYNTVSESISFYL